MELIIKSAVAAVVAAVVSLVIKKSNPELSLMLGVLAAAVALYYGCRAIEPVLDMIREFSQSAALSSSFYTPVLKCLGIGIVTQIGSSICKDAGQAAAATGVELCGTAAAVLCTLPLVRSILSMIGELV